MFTNRTRRGGSWVVVLLMAGCLSAPWALAKDDPDNAQWSVTLVGFFPGEAAKGGGGPKRLNCYLARREGKWAAALATPTNQGRPVWNTAIMLVDPSGAVVKENRLTGTLAITLVPDPWVPKDQKVRTASVTLDATVTPNPDGGEGKGFASVRGKWTAQIAGEPGELAAAVLQGKGEGEIVGSVGPVKTSDLSSDSYDLALYNLIPGKTTENFQRRRALSLGVKGGAVVSARLGQMDMRHNAYDYETLDAPTAAAVAPDGFKASVTFDADTLDGRRVKFALSLDGRRVHDFVAGTWKGTYTAEDGKVQAIEGFLRGNVRAGAFEGTAARDDRPWFIPVKGFVAPKPGEHPRVFFRQADVPELRKRAQSFEGKMIVARLREMLNGSDGETMPIAYNPAKQAYEKNNFKDRPGTYSISHAAGYGFLYQLTGERRYAEFAKQCVEKGWAGQRSGDDRYSWVAPGGELRAGPSVGWTAVAYDLCYDAWPEDFRLKCAKAIQNYTDTKGGEWNNPEGITLEKMVLQPRQGPGSNHFGAVVGGSGLAVLAIRGDAGTDAALADKYLAVLERQVVRHLSAGWGDGGYYKEGWGASRVGTQGGFLCFLQALKVAQGHDYLNVDRSNASFVTMVPRCLMVLRGGDRAFFPYRSNMGGTYGNAEIGSANENDGFSKGGHFSEGFGAVADRYKPALLWAYNHLFCPGNEFKFDTLGPYPHRAMLAMVNWPTFAGIKEQVPSEALPLVTRDRLYEYFTFRNSFTGGESDIVTTLLLNLPDGTRPREVMVWGLGGLRLSFTEPKRGAAVTDFVAASDGSATVTAGEFALAVDYSKASGADALIVTVGGTPGKADLKTNKAKIMTLDCGGKQFHLLTLCASGQHPQPKVEGEKIVVGEQTISYASGKLQLARFASKK